MKPDERERRQPLLADLFLHRHWRPEEKVYARSAIEQVIRGVRSAHRFIFDNAASQRVARVVKTVPDLLVREFQFAIPPFDLMWIEYQAVPFWEVINGHPGAGDADLRVGYLIDHHRINVLVEGNYIGQIGLLPLQYRMHTEWPVQQQIDFCETAALSRMELDGFLWGSTKQHLEPEHHRLLRAYTTVEMVPAVAGAYHQSDKNLRRNMRRLVEGSAGDMRNVIAFLLMLNRPTITRFSNRPSAKHFHRGKLMNYMSHSTVDVDLDAVRTISLVGTKAGESVPRRRHEVRGHFCHDKTAHDYMRIAGCLHDWQACDEEWTPWPGATPADDVRHWQCRACGGKRWHRREHMRGDAGLGFVVRDGYEIHNRVSN